CHLQNMWKVAPRRRRSWEEATSGSRPATAARKVVPQRPVPTQNPTRPANSLSASRSIGSLPNKKPAPPRRGSGRPSPPVGHPQDGQALAEGGARQAGRGGLADPVVLQPQDEQVLEVLRPGQALGRLIPQAVSGEVHVQQAGRTGRLRQV